MSPTLSVSGPAANTVSRRAVSPVTNLAIPRARSSAAIGWNRSVAGPGIGRT
jgi:hypothetical protein